MKQTDTHPDRTDMLTALDSGVVPFADHLKGCRTCRDLFVHLQTLHQAGDASFEAPSEAAISSWISIPLLEAQPSRMDRRHGTITFDSWGQTGAVAVRDISVGDVRRLVLTAGSIVLELVAERLQRGWECVARVYEHGEVSSRYVLSLGRRRLLPTTQGFFHWTSPHGPRAITLLVDKREIEFEHPTWL
jgi:hypothetical protein